MPAQTVIKLRRDTSANWTSANPVLAAGEAGFESDSNKLKIGDGVTAWTSLSYASGGASVEVGDTAPADPEANTLWWNSATGVLYIYYDAFWVEAVVGVVGPQGEPGVDGADGATGAPGVVQQADAPTDTSVLWVDTDDTAEPVAVPAGGEAGQILQKSTSGDYDTTWANVPSHNYIINGGMDISQRGTAITSINSDGTYTADRFYVERGGSMNYAQRQVGSFNPPTNFDYYAEIVNQTASNPFHSIGQPIETLNAYQLAGKVVTISFYARAHANTTASKFLKLRMRSSTSVNTKGGAVFATNSYTLNFGTAATDWQRFSYTATVPTTARTITIDWVQDQTLAVGDGFHITGVQLEAGSVATPFKRHAPSLQGELAACQRYYWRHEVGGANRPLAMGIANGTNSSIQQVQFPVEMRDTPSSLEWSGLSVTDYTSYTIAATYVAINPGDNMTARLDADVASGLTQYRPAFLVGGASGGYLGFSAEL